MHNKVNDDNKARLLLAKANLEPVAEDDILRSLYRISASRGATKHTYEDVRQELLHPRSAALVRVNMAQQSTPFNPYAAPQGDNPYGGGTVHWYGPPTAAQAQSDQEMFAAYAAQPRSSRDKAMFDARVQYTQWRSPCKWGDDCKDYPHGRCRFYHKFKGRIADSASRSRSRPKFHASRSRSGSKGRGKGYGSEKGGRSRSRSPRSDVVCRDFQRNECRRGAACRFQHRREGSSSPSRPFALRRSSSRSPKGFGKGRSSRSGTPPRAKSYGRKGGRSPSR